MLVLCAISGKEGGREGGRKGGKEGGRGVFRPVYIDCHYELVTVPW